MVCWPAHLARFNCQLATVVDAPVSNIRSSTILKSVQKSLTSLQTAVEESKETLCPTTTIATKFHPSGPAYKAPALLLIHYRKGYVYVSKSNGRENNLKSAWARLDFRIFVLNPFPLPCSCLERMFQL